jgi:hypothetical protein
MSAYSGRAADLPEAVPAITTKDLLELVTAIEFFEVADGGAVEAARVVSEAIRAARPITGGKITARWVPEQLPTGADQ